MCFMLDNFNRFELLSDVTPIQYLSRLSELLKGPQIYVKRDDLNILGGGGNKLRKLEFFLGDAIAQGADTIITTGATQSNHARLTAASSRKAGLECELVLSHTVPRYDVDYLTNGNILLDQLFGANIHKLDREDNQAEFVQELYKKLRQQGKSPYIIPTGGSNALGCLGYVCCIDEIAKYSAKNQLKFNYITVVNGSSGTHAGLMAGVKAFNYPTTVIGYTVVRPIQETLPITLDIANKGLQLFAPALAITSEDIILDDNYLGDGYGIPSIAMQEAVQLMAQTEGLLLDPVYTGKAFAGVLSDIRSGKFRPSDKLLFIMTGGSVGLHAYKNSLVEDNV